MSVRVFIDGAEGTTGLEIRDRLAGRHDVTVLVLDEAHRKDAAARRDAMGASDIVILCLPDAAAREAVVMLEGLGTRVIDASSAYRVADGWTYGFAELEPERAGEIAGARLVSNPGCYPTGFLALVRPLIRAGLIPADWPLSVNATSGYSGGGKAMIADYEGGATAPVFRAYALGLAHKHLPEMTAHAGLTHAPIFAPAVANTYRGMVVEVPLPLHALPGAPTAMQLREVLHEAYRDAPLISVAADHDATGVAIEEHAGTDRMTLRVCGNDVARTSRGQARLIATLDNLGKGASGAAVHNLNIMAGLEPLAGLVL